MKKAVFNWSGGKDSSYALHKVLESKEYEIVCLLTTISEKHRRISMHGVREALLDKQADLLNIPLKKIYLPENLEMNSYSEIITKALIELKNVGVSHSIFGDIFLEDLKEYREKQLKKIGLEGVFPLWKIDTKRIAKDYINLGFKTIITAVDGSKLDESFVLRLFDDDFIRRLPENVDPCGENGEFHSFVFDGPIFSKKIPIITGEIVTEFYEQGSLKSKFYFGDLK